MPDIKALSDLTLAATIGNNLALNALILVTPNKVKGIQPQTNGKDGEVYTSEDTILFNYEGEQTVSLTSDVTDHFVEDNSAINDQISLKPVMISTQGYIGELTDIAPYGLETAKSLVNKLTILSGLTPQISISAQIAYNTAKQIYDVANQIKNTSLAIKQPNKLQTKQQIAFNKFFDYWSSRTLFTVQTPWRIFSDCVIVNLRAVQTGDSTEVTDFEVTFKPLRFATTIFTAKDKIKGRDYKDYQGRTFNAGNVEKTFGPAAPSPASPLKGLLK